MNELGNGYYFGETLLSVNGVNVSYEKKVLSDISFEIKDIIRPGVKQGQIISIIGKSGCGKTQLFKVMAGLKKPNSGEVIINGKPVVEGDVSVVFQSYPLFGHRTLLNNLLIVTKDKNEINKWLEIFDLKEHVNKYPKHLSGGQRQRVSIVQQILTKNKFILLDEPFSGLDSVMIDKLTHAIVSASHEDDLLTFVIISHDLENSLAISDCAFILNKTTPDSGSSIIKRYDLAQMGLAWDASIKNRVEFRNIIDEIKTLI